jgi:PAS domain S-box-containing protein
MNRILLLLENPVNRKLLAEALRTRYEIVSAAPIAAALDSRFDLGILDGLALTTLWEAVQACKKRAEPLFLPFLLITSRQDVGMATRHLWQTIDEVITAPIEQVELQARVASLLQTRRMSKEIYRVALQESLHAAAILNRDGVIQFWNRAAERLFGWSEAEMLGTSPSVVRSDDPAWWEVLVNESVTTGAFFQREVWLTTKTHQRFVAEVSCTPLRVQGTGSQITHVLLMVRDMTERRQAWETQRRRLRELEALDRITGTLQQARTVHEALHALLNETLAVLEISAGAIWLWQRDTDDLRLIAATDWLQAFADASIKPGEGVVGQTFAQGATLIVRELTPAAFERSAVVGRVPAKWGSVCIPIRTPEGIAGVFLTACPLAQRLHLDHVNILESMARVAGMTLQRLQNNEDIRTRARYASMLRLIDQAIIDAGDLSGMLNAMMLHIVDHLPADAAVVQLRASDAHTFETAAQAGLRHPAMYPLTRAGESLAGQAALERHLVLSSDYVSGEWQTLTEREQFVFGAALPLILKDDLIGVLALFYRSAFRPDSNWIDGVESAAQRIALGIERMRLLDLLRDDRPPPSAPAATADHMTQP